MKTSINYIVLSFCIVSIMGCFYAIQQQFKIINHLQLHNLKEMKYRDQQEQKLLHRIKRLEYLNEIGTH